jgi:putative oxidoreductase
MWTNLALLFLRLVVGILFVGHGTQKAFGWFGGVGFKGMTGWLASMGIKPAPVHAALAASFETLGGLLLLFGVETWLGAAMIVAVMLVAIKTVHLAKGVWNTNGGYEYPLTLIAIAAVLAATGPGAYTLPALLAR